ncbi:MAG: DNA repair protein RecN [Bdellovibrionota bacterium]
MLSRISISDLAIVPEAQVEFDRQFNVLTGETGAGKSILIEAISLLAGRKASQDDVRQGSERALVEAQIDFVQPEKIKDFLMDSAGIEIEDGTLILRRWIGKDGRSKAFVNEKSCTISFLQALSKHWLDVTSQHGSQMLMDEANHIYVLDDSSKLEKELEQYQQTFDQVRDIDSKLREIDRQKQKAKEEKEFLQYQFKELKESKLVEGELQEIETTFQKAKHGEKLANAFEDIHRQFYGERDVVSSLGSITRQLEKISDVDETLAGLLEKSRDVEILVDDLKAQLDQYRGSLGIDHSEIEDLNQRMATLQKVVRKYGSIEAAIEKRDGIGKLLASLEDDSEEEVLLRDQLKRLEKELVLQAEKLRGLRSASAVKLSKGISKELSSLGMSQAKVEFLMEDATASGTTLQCGSRYFHRRGMDTVRIQFSPNPGEGFRLLSSIASGGELSRILLAIKCVSIEQGQSPDVTFLFDEVDTGIGGETAERLGLQMMKLSQGRQVFCVTHLAQVACYAHHHYRVKKEVRSARTMANIEKLSEKQRKEELGRMIGGISVTQPMMAHAQELFDKGVLATQSETFPLHSL